MIVNQRIENATKNVQAEGRGLCRVLAVGVLLAAAPTNTIEYAIGAGMREDLKKE